MKIISLIMTGILILTAGCSAVEEGALDKAETSADTNSNEVITATQMA